MCIDAESISTLSSAKLNHGLHVMFIFVHVRFEALTLSFAVSVAFLSHFAPKSDTFFDQTSLLPRFWRQQLTRQRHRYTCIIHKITATTQIDFRSGSYRIEMSKRSSMTYLYCTIFLTDTHSFNSFSFALKISSVVKPKSTG